MKRLNSYRMRLAVVGIMAGIIFGGGRAMADFTFGEPTNLGPTINSPGFDFRPSVSGDALSLYYVYDGVEGDEPTQSIHVTKRENIHDPWGTPVNIGALVNSGAGAFHPSVSVDGLELYFVSRRSGAYGKRDIWVSKRATINDDWDEPSNLGPIVNTVNGESAPNISSDGLTLFFRTGSRPGVGSGDIWMTKRTTQDDPWGEPQNLGPTVNSSVQEYYMSISVDGLVLFFDSARGGGLGSMDLYYTRRRTTDDDWAPPVNLGPAVNSTDWDGCPDISADGSTLYLTSTRAGGFGGYDLWQVPIVPIVDFNGDRIVDADDMCIMVDHWGTDNQLCDIGPMPWGDGVVDVQDLIVLAEHLFEELPGRPIQP